MDASSVARRTAWWLAASGLAYLLFVAALSSPRAQRNALYAHWVNPALFQDLSNVEQFGFYHRQVQPFTLNTSDGVTLYGWHILPTELYLEHEARLCDDGSPGLPATSDDIWNTPGFSLLESDPNAQVILSFHGQAAHLASSHRPQTYQQLLALAGRDRPVHVIAFDYRGFGLSTGSPTEEGIITDAVTVLSFLTGLSMTSNDHADKAQQQVLSTHSINPSQITLLGQSLGTAVATALYHRWTLNMHLPAPRGVILLASFTSLPSLVGSYSIKGVIPPLLTPLQYYPPWYQQALGWLADTWNTAARIKEILETRHVPFDLTILHAADDLEIPVREGQKNWEAVEQAVGGEGVMKRNETIGGSIVSQWQSDSNDGRRVRWEIVRHGGHNRVAVGEQMKATVLRVLNRDPIRGNLQSARGAVGSQR